MALAPFQWGGGGQKLSPEQVRQRNAIAQQLMSQTQAPTTFGGGLARVGDTLRGIHMQNTATEAEEAGRAEASEVVQALLANPEAGVSDYAGALGNEWLDPGSSAVLGALLEQKLKAQQPKDPIEVGGVLLDPETYEPIFDSRTGEGQKPMSINDQLVDPATGEVIGDYRDPIAPPDRKYETDPAGIPRYIDTGEPVFPGVEAPQEFGGDQFDTESKLRTEYQGQQGYKDFNQQTQAYQRVLDSAQNASPAGDLALIFNYMKVLDPGSVVRESEFATAAASGAFGDRIQAAVQQVTSGERLSDTMRKDFVTRAGDLYRGASEIYGGLNERFSTLAQGYGIDPARVVAPAPTIGVLDPEFNIDEYLAPDGTQTQPFPVTNDAEFDALPSGAVFQAPDGSIRKKP